MRAFQKSDKPGRRGGPSSVWALLGFVGLCVLVWAANGALTVGSVKTWYPTLTRPPGTPPDWLFAPVWTTLYGMIGVSAWLVWRRIDVGIERKRAALRLWGWQLAANAVWPAMFFGLHQLGFSLVVIGVLLVLIGATIAAFWPLQRAAALLLCPYLAWVCYAAYLNAGLWHLNT